MKNINDANEVSFDQLLILRRMLAFNQSLDKSFNLDDRTLYDIRFIQRSVSSWILFVQSPITGENLVLKLLSDYQDARYDLSSSEKRLICQVEALKWNSKFSPDIYYGLACVLNLNANQRQIILSPSVLNPTKDELLTNADYALVMRSLPEERRLDILMSTMSDVSLRDCLQKVVERISQIHKSLEPFSYKESVQWGSYEHIKRKFEHNLALANPIFSIDENKNYIYPDTVRNAFL